MGSQFYRQAKGEKLDKVNMTKPHENVPWLCSCRVALALMCFLGLVNLYALRVNISVAMVCMINQTTTISTSEFNETKEVNEQCLRENINSTGGQAENGELEWSKATQGFVLSSFFWGYVITQVPGGWLSTKFGGKRVFGWFMFACAVATLLMPVAARTHAAFLMFLRIVAGMGQGMVLPAMHAVWAYWAPPLERGKLIGFTLAGAQIGTVLTFPLAGLLCEYGFDGGWPSIFYVLGGLGILWFIAWMFIVYDTPEQHPRISQAEKDYIQNSLIGQTGKKIHNEKIPWLAFLKSKAVWAIIITHMCGNWTVYTFLTNMPSYLKEVLKFDIKKNGLLSAIPFILMWGATVVSGFLADTLRSRRILSTTNVRKLNHLVGMLIPAIFCIILGYIDCTKWIIAMCLVTVAVALLGCLYGAGYVVNHADIAPKYASLLFGISNTTATIPGFLAPTVIGIITKDRTQAQWRIVFFIAAAITSFGSIFYLLTGSGDVQEWARDTSGLEGQDGEAQKPLQKDRGLTIDVNIEDGDGVINKTN